jgi:hypothetical protein
MDSDLLFIWSVILSAWTLALFLVTWLFWRSTGDFQEEKREFYSWIENERKRGTRERV